MSSFRMSDNTTCAVWKNGYRVAFGGAVIIQCSSWGGFLWHAQTDLTWTDEGPIPSSQFKTGDVFEMYLVTEEAEYEGEGTPIRFGQTELGDKTTMREVILLRRGAPEIADGEQELNELMTYFVGISKDELLGKECEGYLDDWVVGDEYTFTNVEEDDEEEEEEDE